MEWSVGWAPWPVELYHRPAGPRPGHRRCVVACADAQWCVWCGGGMCGVPWSMQCSLPASTSTLHAVLWAGGVRVLTGERAVV